jgi:hypothetical protein
LDARTFNQALRAIVPERPPRIQLVAYLENARDDHQKEKKAELVRLLEAPLPMVAPEDESMKTTIYVERSSLTTPLTTPGIRNEEPVADTHKLALSATALLPPKRSSRAATVALVAAALVVGLVAGTQLSAPEKTVEPAPIVAPNPEPQPRPSVTAIPTPVEAEDPAPSNETQRTKTVRVERPKTEHRPPVRETTVKEDRSAAPADLGEMLRSLETRANALGAKLPQGDSRHTKLEQLLLEITMVRSIRDPERAESQFRKLERDLDRLGTP